MASAPRPERRRHRRADAKRPLEIQVSGRRVEGTTIDLGAAGTRCLVSEEFRLFEKVAVGLRLGTPGGTRRPIRAQGVVVRVATVGGNSSSRPLYEVAVFFSQIGPRARAAVQRFVQAQLKQ